MSLSDSAFGEEGVDHRAMMDDDHSNPSGAAHGSRRAGRDAPGHVNRHRSPRGPSLPASTALTAARPFTAGRLRRLVRGRAEDPAWARPGLLGVLALAAVLVGWGLTRS